MTLRYQLQYVENKPHPSTPDEVEGGLSALLGLAIDEYGADRDQFRDVYDTLAESAKYAAWQYKWDSNQATPQDAADMIAAAPDYETASNAALIAAREFSDDERKRGNRAFQVTRMRAARIALKAARTHQDHLFDVAANTYGDIVHTMIDAADKLDATKWTLKTLQDAARAGVSEPWVALDDAQERLETFRTWYSLGVSWGIAPAAHYFKNAQLATNMRMSRHHYKDLTPPRWEALRMKRADAQMIRGASGAIMPDMTLNGPFKDPKRPGLTPTPSAAQIESWNIKEPE